MEVPTSREINGNEPRVGRKRTMSIVFMDKRRTMPTTTVRTKTLGVRDPFSSQKWE